MPDDALTVRNGRFRWWRSPRALRIDGQGVQIDPEAGGARIPYAEITGLERARGEGRFEITLVTRRGRYRIRRGARPGSREIWEALARCLCEGSPIPGITSASAPLPSDAPEAFHACIRQALAGAADRPVHLIPSRDIQQGLRATIYGLSVVMAIIGLAVLSLASGDGRIGGGVILMIGLLLAGANRLSTRRRSQYLLVSGSGIALWGHWCTGELAWKEMVSVAIRPPVSFAISSGGGVVQRWRLEIRTQDGDEVDIPDVFETPLPMLEQLFRSRISA